VLQSRAHSGLKTWVGDLNGLYRSVAALHARDCESDGFRWIVADDADQSVYAWIRFGGPSDAPVAIISNFTPVPRLNYRIGLPKPGRWREILNSDAIPYGGSGHGNFGSVVAQDIPSHGYPYSAEIVIPPLATIYFQSD
jgi:1,4-alpha-glucan branching enzyme